MSHIVQVLLPLPFDKAFDYAVPENQSVSLGQWVTVPFGQKKLKGVVWSAVPASSPVEKIRSIENISDVRGASDSFRRFVEWGAEYTASPLGSILAMVLSVPDALEPLSPRKGYRISADNAAQRVTPKRQQILDALEQGQVYSKKDISERAGVSVQLVTDFIQAGGLLEAELPEIVPSIEILDSPITLSPQQKEAAEKLQYYVAEEAYHAVVLDGVTGSGKTEVYFEAIRTALEKGKQVLVMLPEIILTNQFIQRFEAQFGFTPTQWHSSLTPKKRRENWRDIAEGKARLIVGARSALFLPYPSLGLIVVDEEHESSYKQEEGVIYHGRDMAVVRANIEKLPVILASASPSVETMVNVEAGKFSLLRLPERHGAAEMPDMTVVDMRQEQLDAQHWISSPLKEALAQTLVAREQSLLYLNRRGYAPLTLCRRCGYRFQSPDSSSWMVLHQPPHRAPYLQCHHSGYIIPLPERCPECNEKESFAACGPGVERLEEEVKELFPEARIVLMTSDTITTASQAEDLVRRILSKEVDIIIGTQMVAKGHHFPHLTLVGVVDADLGMEGGDLRAAERSFQLLHQVSGRAGRTELPGRVFVQSYMPENMVIQALQSHDRDEFVAQEIERRRRADMPPFSRLAGIIISGKEENEVCKAAQILAKYAPSTEYIKVFGPAPAPMVLLRGRYRYRLLLKTARNIRIQEVIRQWLVAAPESPGIKIRVDIDPQSFM